MKDHGITLIELVVVMAVISMLAVALAFDYSGWKKRYAVERIVKDLYTDMMHARMMAITRNREHYVILGTWSYSVVEDTNDSGEHDAGDTTLPDYPKQLEHPIEWNNSGNALTFDRRGLMPKWRTIHVTDADADYNCIKISTSRIIMGQYIEKDKECQAK